MVDIVECSFSILGNMVGSCVIILSEDKLVVEVIINVLKFLFCKEFIGCFIIGIIWLFLKEIVCEMVELFKFEEWGVMIDFLYYNGYLREVFIKIVLFMDDLEVYCLNLWLLIFVEVIVKERDVFYKGV